MLSTRQKILYGLLTSMGLFIVADVLFRGYLLVDSNLGRMVSEHRYRNAPEISLEATMEPHPYFIYTHSTLRPDVNSWGFTFDELPLEKPKDTIRVVCLGASTTAGQDAWPYWLGQALEKKGMRVEVLNFGVQAWTSAESLNALMFLGLDFQPDHVRRCFACHLAFLSSSGSRLSWIFYRWRTFFLPVFGESCLGQTYGF